MNHDNTVPTEAFDPTEEPGWGQLPLPEKKIRVTATPFPLGLQHATECPCAGCRERRTDHCEGDG